MDVLFGAAGIEILGGLAAEARVAFRNSLVTRLSTSWVLARTWLCVELVHQSAELLVSHNMVIELIARRIPPVTNVSINVNP